MTEYQALYFQAKRTHESAVNMVDDLKRLRRKAAKATASLWEMFARIDLACVGIQDPESGTIRRRISALKERHCDLTKKGES